MSPLKNSVDTLSVLKSVYFFIANTNEVESNKMIATSLKTLMIKVLVFILSNLLSSRRLEVDTQQLNVPDCNIALFQV